MLEYEDMFTQHWHTVVPPIPLKRFWKYLAGGCFSQGEMYLDILPTMAIYKGMIEGK